jgi:hypothetical protein
MVDRRDNPTERAGRLRDFLARMISSNRRIAALDAGCLSRSWMNSLKTADSGKYVNVNSGHTHWSHLRWVSLIIVA